MNIDLVAYPLISAIATFWMVVRFRQWCKARTASSLLAALLLLSIVWQFNWLSILRSVPGVGGHLYLSEEQMPWGWLMVGILWLLQSAAVVLENRGDLWALPVQGLFFSCGRFFAPSQSTRH